MILGFKLMHRSNRAKVGLSSQEPGKLNSPKSSSLLRKVKNIKMCNSRLRNLNKSLTRPVNIENML